MIIGMLIFPDMTQLDHTGPYEVFARLPGCEVKIISQSLQPVAAKGGLKFVPDTTIDRNRITGGGVTAGIDFALTIAGELFGAETAKTI